MLRNILNSMKESLSLDLRSLALFRIMIGGCVLTDLCIRSMDLETFYTDSGVVPRIALLKHLWHTSFFSIHISSGNYPAVVILFIAAAACAISMMVGYKTRLSTVLCWLLTLSLQARNPLVLQGGDIALRLFLFWGMFLPLGAHYSVDLYRRNKHNDSGNAQLPSIYFSVPGACLLVQLVMIYFHSALLKSGVEWSDGTALYYALELERYSRQPFASWLLNLMSHHPRISLLICKSAYWLEFFTPVVLLFSVKHPFRLIAVAVYCGLHLTYSLFLNVGIFSLVMFSGWAAFLPMSALTRSKTNRHEQIDDPIGIMTPNISQWLTLPFLILSILWNHQQLPPEHDLHISLPLPIKQFTTVLRLDQRWDMFAPQPSKDDGWFVMPGKLENETEVFLSHHDKHLVMNTRTKNMWKKPKNVADFYGWQRWRKYLENLYAKNNTNMRLYFGQWLCREINSSREEGKRLKTFQIYFAKETTPPPGESHVPLENVHLWEHKCF